MVLSYENSELDRSQNSSNFSALSSILLLINIKTLPNTNYTFCYSLLKKMFLLYLWFIKFMFVIYEISKQKHMITWVKLKYRLKFIGNYFVRRYIGQITMGDKIGGGGNRPIIPPFPSGFCLILRINTLWIMSYFK